MEFYKTVPFSTGPLEIEQVDKYRIDKSVLSVTISDLQLEPDVNNVRSRSCIPFDACQRNL
jgi:hypothetical protein